MTELSTRIPPDVSIPSPSPIPMHPPEPDGRGHSRVALVIRGLRSRLRHRRGDRRLPPRDAALHGGDPHLKYHSFPRHLR